jgi:hypothetical protein
MPGAAIVGLKPAHARHGLKYEVKCTLRTPDGRDPCLTTIWTVERGRPPRLVTAYG